MSFFDTEEAHAVMLAYAANGGPVDHRSSGPGSSGKSRLKAPAQFGAKKDIHVPHYCRVKQNRFALLFCGIKAIIDFSMLLGFGIP
jgi:hypothetical protein